jgi:four helix bundle protein
MSAARFPRRAKVEVRGDSLRELEETGYWLELLVAGNIVEPAKVSAFRQECDELIAIFVTILKRSKVTS